jgi:hypothetical protein
MPTSEHGSLENPEKSAYSLEFYDSSWEREYMKKLENSHEIRKWTKNHGIQIPYFDNDGKFHVFKPDFLVEKSDGGVEIHEIKGTQFLNNPITKKKFEAAIKFCEARKVKFKILSKHQ